LNKKISFVTKLFLWSLIFESLLYFVLGSQQYTGISLSLGRGIQAITIFFLLVLNRKVPLLQLFKGHLKWFTYLFIFSIFSAIIGLFTQGYLLKNIYVQGFSASFFSKFIRSSMVRPFFEYFILLYYILYFVIMPFYLIKTEDALFYFFKMFRKMFLFGLFIGLLDLVALKVTGFQFLGRDILDGVTVGFRFHGFAGEPRDAFVYLFYSLCLFNLESVFKYNKLIPPKYNLGVLILMLLTQSASGILGIIIGSILLFVQISSKISFKQIIILLLSIISLAIFLSIGIFSSDRIIRYADAFWFMMEALENEVLPPLVFVGQMNNIYPIWDLYIKLKGFNILPLLFGSGFGSASVANNNWGNALWSELVNPASQIVRILYETGILGLWLYIVTFFKQAKIHTFFLSDSKQKFFIYTMLMLIGLSLSHRSTTIFIYTGILITTMEIYKRKISSNII
jgi:hypothetical protein